MALHALPIRPKGLICNDGGRGLDDSGIEGLAEMARHGLAAAAVSSASARITQRRASAIRPVASVGAHIKTKRWNDPERADRPQRCHRTLLQKLVEDHLTGRESSAKGGRNPHREGDRVLLELREDQLRVTPNRRAASSTVRAP